MMELFFDFQQARDVLTLGPQGTDKTVVSWGEVKKGNEGGYES